MSILYIQSLVLVTYAIFSLLLPIKVNLPIRIAVLAVILICGLKYVIYGFTGGILEPKLPSFVVVVMESLFATLLLCVFMLIIKDLVSLVLFILRKFDLISFSLSQNKAAVIISVIAISLGFYGTFYQYITPKIKTHEIEIANLPQELDGYKILQLTDIHIGPILKQEYVARLVDRTNQENPDVIVFTGDFVDGDVKKLAKEFEPLKNLQATNGVFAVTGNHEYYSGAAGWIEALTKLNIRFLNNENAVVTKDGAQVAIVGVPDVQAPRFGFEGQDLDRALANIPEIPRVLLAHEPAIANEHPPVNLILTGHTHGGTMFFLKPLIARFNGGYVSGMYDVTDNLKLYVSNGSGIWSGFSCRVGVDSEITTFILRSK